MSDRTRFEQRETLQEVPQELIDKYRDRFWAKVAIGKPEACWEWQGYIDENGYGRIQISHNYKYKTFRTHRFAWHLTNGEINDCILHSCDNRKCVNPNHLRDGSYLDNTNDKRLRGRFPNTFGEKNSNSKLSITEARFIKYNSSYIETKVIANWFGVAPITIKKIRNGESWPDV